MISLTLVLVSLGLGSAAPTGDAEGWQFPTVQLRPGDRLPNFALPTLTSEEPVHLYDLLGGKKTVLHVFASW